MINALLIFLGGGLGAVSRWGLSSGIQALTQKSTLARFPLGILTCNVLGCFLIGCLFGHFMNRNAPSWVFPFLATGFLGGFTTFSTFAKDTHSLWIGDLGHLAILKVLLSVMLALVAVFWGIKITQTTI